MADTKISAFTAVTALAGTEVVPVVQGGSNKKATIDQILTPAAAKGVNFTANTALAGKTSQLLNWYEEGTYVPTVTGLTSGTVTINASYNTLSYVRIGRQVTITGQLRVSSTTGVGSVVVTLPWAINSAGSQMDIGCSCWYFNGAGALKSLTGAQSGTTVALDINAATVAPGDQIRFSFSYFV